MQLAHAAHSCATRTRILHVPSETAVDAFSGRTAVDSPRTPSAQSQRISRGAVAHLLRLRGLSALPQSPFLVDVRRPDEAALYGTLPDANLLPADMAPFAFAAPPEDFGRFVLFERPALGQLLVFYSRVEKRAAFAAAIAEDHGALVPRPIAFAHAA